MPDIQPTNIQKLILPDGFRVGIVDLDNILREVAGLKLYDAIIIKEELLKRADIKNYIPSGARNEYAAALFREYRRKFEPDNYTEEKIETHKHTPG